LANKADLAGEALVIGVTNKVGANEADKATDVTGANEADVVNKSGKADKAKAHKANEAANEADAKAAIAYESKSCRGR
jgi:hypothetical protein